MKKFAALGATLSLFAALLAYAAVSTPQLPPLNSPPTTESLPGKFVWFDLATPSIASQTGFYSSVFGWTFESPARTDDGYMLIMNKGQPVAGMFEFKPPGGEGDGAAWIALMSVSDPDAASATVKANGGSVEVEPVNVPGRGRHAVFRDPAGAVFGVLRSDSGDPYDEVVETGGIIWVDLFARDVEAMSNFYGALAPFRNLGSRNY